MERAEIERELVEKQQEHAQAIANANAIWGVMQYLAGKLAALPAEKRIVVPGPSDRIPSDHELKKVRG
jgi:hypothetical protein